MKDRPQFYDWKLIRQAFLSGMTYTQMSEQFGASRSTICARAKREHWDNLKRYAKEEAERKLVETISTEHAKRELQIAEKVVEGVESCVDKVITGLKSASSKDYTKLRAYMSILKDAREMGIYRSDMDIAEQTARIKKLEKDASALEEDNTINVVISAEVDDYAN